MMDTIHFLIERYGLIAVFVGCLAEGESAAVLAGFFAHQHVFATGSAFLATFAGAFMGDALFFTAGRLFRKRPVVKSISLPPGFNRALGLIARRPATYVMLNRYVYGFRLVGGVAAGFSAIPVPQFLILNALSSAVWAMLFLGIGYVFGLGAEQIVGAELARHQRLFIGLGIAVVVEVAAGVTARHFARRRRGRGH